MTEQEVRVEKGERKEDARLSHLKEGIARPGFRHFHNDILFICLEHGLQVRSSVIHVESLVKQLMFCALSGASVTAEEKFDLFRLGRTPVAIDFIDRSRPVLQLSDLRSKGISRFLVQFSKGRQLFVYLDL